jgi:AcrR family transcriptional regulator
MPRKPDSEASKDAILAAGIALLKRGTTTRVSVDAVAKEAGVAKGLVHYHFKTKKGLFETIAGRLAADRRQAWEHAFRKPDPQQAIDGTWALLTAESDDGTLLAWDMLFGSSGVLPEQTVRDETEAFGGGLGAAAQGMLARLGLHPSIPVSEIGALLSAIVQGMGTLLVRGSDAERLHGAYAAAWVGLLSLTRK